MTGNHTPCVKAVQLSKSYGPIEALRDVSFEISEGEIVGLLGPNGAGKTTMLKILTGYLQPDEGGVQVDGLDVLAQPREVQARIGYLPENAPLYPELSVQAYLRMMAELRQIPRDQQLSRISEAVYATGLAEPRAGGSDQLARPIGELSKGYRQRVGLAQAILHQPKLLILDEPTVGLDPTQIIEVRGLIRRLAEHPTSTGALRATVLFSTHILSEVEALCDRVIILINGQVKTDARLADLEVTADAILVLGAGTGAESRALSGTVERALPTLSGVRGIEPLRCADGYAAYRVLGMGDVDLCPVLYDLARSGGWPLRELRRDVRTLETVFNQLATGDKVAL
jgi:ABC-2 type transport system ATP-binding protein